MVLVAVLAVTTTEELGHLLSLVRHHKVMQAVLLLRLEQLLVLVAVVLVLLEQIKQIAVWLVLLVVQVFLLPSTVRLPLVLVVAVLVVATTITLVVLAGQVVVELGQPHRSHKQLLAQRTRAVVVVLAVGHLLAVFMLVVLLAEQVS